jgi:hypothetical protein
MGTGVDVFISHRGADMEEARRLADKIRAAGHTVWLDEWEIGIGDSIVERMNDGLQGATDLVVCYSSSGVTSPWMSRKWMAALTR